MTTLSVDVSNIVDGQQIDAADVTTPVNQLKTHLENTLNGVQAFDRVSMGTAEALTIATDAVTATKTHIKVDTEAAAASDDLKTINGGAEGRWITLRIANSARVVTLKHGTGNIHTASGSDYVMNSTDMMVWMVHDGTNWIAMMLPAPTTLNLAAATTLTISAGAVTKTRSRHSIDTEGSASSDDLDTISGGTAGDKLIIQMANSARAVRVRHGTGNIYLADRVHRTLDNPRTQIELTHDGTGWVEGFNNWRYPPPWQGDVRELICGLAASPYNAAKGMAAGTNTGTASGGGFESDNGIVYSTYTTAASANAFAGVATTYDLVYPRATELVFEAVVGTCSSTAVKLWIGLTSALVTSTTDDPGTTFIGFRFSAGTDSGWVGLHSAFSTTTTAALTSGIPTATPYSLLRARAVWAENKIYFSVNYGPETSLSVTFSNNILGMNARIMTTAAVAKSMNLARMTVRSLHL